MPPIIRLKHQDKQNQTEARNVVELAYGKFNVPFTRIFATNEGYKVICRNENDADKILGKEAKKELEKLGLQVIVPPETKARRSIILRHLDQIIGTNTPEDIKAEIERENNWLKIEEVIKIKDYTHILKLRLEETSMVDKAQQQGILAYNMAISPTQIEQETYVHIKTCFNCYQMEDHITKECPFTDLKICSECSETGHTYRECRNPEKACINCKSHGYQANHRTLAMSCPMRKKIISNKLNETKNNDKEQNTYAAIAKRAVAEAKQTESPTQINLSELKHTKILISIMHAHVMNLCNPGTYESELNKMLEKNKLPSMWFPENPDSSRLLGATYQTQENTINETSCTETNTVTSTPKTRIRSQSRTRNTSEQTMDQYHTPREAEYPENAPEIGLKIHLTGKQWVPTKDPHIEYILEQIQHGNFKWTYTDTEYEEDTIKRLLTQQKIKITKNDFKRIDEGSFRKIRNGLNVRSPIQDIRKTKKHI